jgi:hypothetical protein
VQQAIRDMETPFLSVSGFIDQQIKSLLEKYEEWTKQKDEYDRRSKNKR